MESNQRERRRAATRAFIESLDKLQEALAIDETPSSQGLSKDHASLPMGSQPEAINFDLNILEQAAEDIEQFIQAKQQQSSSDNIATNLDAQAELRGKEGAS